MRQTTLFFSLILFALSALVFSSCKKNPDAVKYNPNQLPPEQTVTASIQGRVVDENGVPVQGAAVSSGTATATTDVNGVFLFTDIAMSSRFGSVKVVKSGYFAGSRSITTNAGQLSYVTIQLIPRKETGSFSAANGGNVTVGTGNSVAFPKGAIVTDAAKTAYTGTVHVFAAYLDPTSKTMSELMPGDLRGIDSLGKETMMSSFGMLLVELQDDNGNKLQVAAGQQATLTWAIVPKQQSTAPTSIPLWYYNDSTGRWIMQGTAVRQGNSYVGQVSHFTWWNVDRMLKAYNFTVRLVDQNGKPIAYAKTSMWTPDSNTLVKFTDSAGILRMLVPEIYQLTLNVFSPCESILSQINLGSVLADIDLGTVVINITNGRLTVTGTVVDCINNPVDSGSVILSVDGLSYGAKVTNGAFALTIVRCSAAAAQVTGKAFDLKANQGGDLVSKTASSAQATTLDMGQLSACGEVIQYISMSWKGINHSWSETSASFTFREIDSASNTFTSFTITSIPNTSTSTYIGMSFNPGIKAVGMYNAYLYYYPQINSNLGYIEGSIQVSISSVGPINGFIIGSFSGSMYDTDSKSNLPISGYIQIKKTQ